MLRYNLIDADSLSNLGDGDGINYMWEKYELIIRTQRKLYGLGEHWLWGFEYLAGEMLKIAKIREPSYKIPETYSSYIPENKSP